MQTYYWRNLCVLHFLKSLTVCEVFTHYVHIVGCDMNIMVNDFAKIVKHLTFVS